MFSSPATHQLHTSNPTLTLLLRALSCYRNILITTTICDCLMLLRGTYDKSAARTRVLARELRPCCPHTQPWRPQAAVVRHRMLLLPRHLKPKISLQQACNVDKNCAVRNTYLRVHCALLLRLSKRKTQKSVLRYTHTYHTCTFVCMICM